MSTSGDRSPCGCGGPRGGRRPGDVEGTGVSSPNGRVAALRRLEETAVGSRALQRLAELVVRLLGASAARISLLGDTETVVSGAGPPPGTDGGWDNPGSP